MKDQIIRIYTDGSCHTQKRTGAWAAIIFYDQKKEILKEIVENTTHNRMELLAIINAVEWVKQQQISFQKIEIYSDSQYAVRLQDRKEKLKENNFITKKGTPIQNIDLVQELIRQIENFQIELIKVAAHQKTNTSDNFNRDVDLIVRELMRNAL